MEYSNNLKFMERKIAMLLKTERLVIRHITENDWKSIQKIWEDFNASEFAKYDRPHNTDDEAVRERILHGQKLIEGWNICFLLFA